MWNQTGSHVIPTRSISLRIGLAIRDVAAGLERSSAKGRGIEFYGLREFHDAVDSPRDIDWFASARTVDDTVLVSREFSPEYRISVLVIADEHCSMLSPERKPRCASALVGALVRAACANENQCAIVGFGGETVPYSDWSARQEDLDAFLAMCDDPRQRQRCALAPSVAERFFEELHLQNTLVVFVTDLATSERVSPETMRILNVGRNVRGVAVVLDEWSGFAPLPHALMVRHPEDGTCAVLDTRRGGGIEREANMFRARLAELRYRGRAAGLSVVTVPLADEDPLRSFAKQWQRVMEDD